MSQLKPLVLQNTLGKIRTRPSQVDLLRLKQYKKAHGITMCLCDRLSETYAAITPYRVPQREIILIHDPD